MRLLVATVALSGITAWAQPSDWETRAIIGWTQSGASSATAAQRIFLDFFTIRPLSGRAGFESDFSLWGQVRVASTPQQRSVPVSQFAAGFVANLATIRVNELAQSGEFLSGFEYRPRCSSRFAKGGGFACWQAGAGVRTLGFVAFFGANGAFTDSVTQYRIFRVPAADSPQWGNFVSQFPDFRGEAFRAQAAFIGLVPPDRERFYRQFGAGLRYTRYAADSAPAMFTATVGQDQMITGGRYRGPVAKFDAFYPLPIGKQGRPPFLYLFATANLAVVRPKSPPPLALEPIPVLCAPGDPGAGMSCDVKPYQANVAVYAVPSSRDNYRLGVGLDLIGLIRTWAGLP